ncbi:hypothetical protein L6164_023519 [Bauhinia variegata]|uniref:Uncharacterized protein n=1 Tax=Bauhinia variegata TaxID=167791 RepID=A0ACB9MIW6_BAUVA|nr:hypothetical protein L6164_023519 [Bauhinia variegata]
MSMAPKIMKRYLRLPTAREIWNALSKAFYDGSDVLQVFALNQKAFTAKQNGKSLSEYYGELVEIFQELDHRDTVVMKDPDDVITYKKSIERLRVHIFLAGLDEEFDQVRGEILHKELVPGLEECHALIRREATGHTKDRCYELVGYPEWWDHSQASKKRNPKNISNVAEANIGGNALGKGSALIATADTCDDFRNQLEDGKGQHQLEDVEEHLQNANLEHHQQDDHNEGVPIGQDENLLSEPSEHLPNTPHQSSTEVSSVLEPELPRK